LYSDKAIEHVKSKAFKYWKKLLKSENFKVTERIQIA
jgi:hypothetical protein